LWERVDFSKQVKLSAGSTNLNKESGSNIGVWDAISMIKERSKGAIDIDYFMNGVLGNEASMLAQCMEGSLDLTQFSIGSVSQYCPWLDLIQLPFLINSYELEYKVIKLKEFKALEEKANEDLGSVQLLGFFEFGMRHFATIKGPIKTIADIKGLKIRSIGNPVIDEALRIVGANPVKIPYTELYSALQNGVIDGEEINTTSIAMQKHYEVIKYFSEIGLYPFLSMAAISNDTVKSLPPGYFDLIKACYAEAQEKYMSKSLYEWDSRQTKDCLEHDLIINTIEDKTEWIKAMSPLYEKKMTEHPLYADFIKAVRALQ
jgi:TRAP-type C4-dicarboxylate transport system substrate-binding protein